MEAVIAANEQTTNTLVVLPTGAGKSHVIAGICASNPGKPVLIISHVKEILSQNAEKLKQYVDPNLVGIYSSGLQSKQLSFYCVASIQSIYKKAELFSKYKIIIIDEAHMIPPSGEGRYVTFLERMAYRKVIGLTATPFRMNHGMLTAGHIFNNICYTADIVSLIDKGYLCNLTSKQTALRIDTTNLKVIAGDYSKKDMSVKIDRSNITERIVQELVSNCTHRKSWLVFAIDIAHAEHINEELTRQGIRSAVIHSQMDLDRGIFLDLFKGGYIQALVSIETLTTGFDAPNIDLIALLRPTQSPVLHIQMIGRGLRIAPGKTDCLVLDFAGNVETLGPINDTNFLFRKANKDKGEPLTKVCPECHEIVYLAAKTCKCGFDFPINPPKNKLFTTASSRDIIALASTKRFQTLPIDKVTYMRHKKKDKPDSLRVVYHCGLTLIEQWIFFEYEGRPKALAQAWWRHRTTLPFPSTTTEALKYVEFLRKPLNITVYLGNKYPEITKVELE